MLPPQQGPCTVPNIPAVLGLEPAPGRVTQPLCYFGNPVLGLDGSLGSGSLVVLLREGILGALGVALVVPPWISGMGWDGVHAWCPSLTPWPRRRQRALQDSLRRRQTGLLLLSFLQGTLNT